MFGQSTCQSCPALTSFLLPSESETRKRLFLGNSGPDVVHFDVVSCHRRTTHHFVRRRRSSHREEHVVHIVVPLKNLIRQIGQGLRDWVRPRWGKNKTFADVMVFRVLREPEYKGRFQVQLRWQYELQKFSTKCFVLILHPTVDIILNNQTWFTAWLVAVKHVECIFVLPKCFDRRRTKSRAECRQDL